MKKTQLILRFRKRKRGKVGRPPKGKKAGVSHLRREELSRHHGVHVTLRTAAGVGYLRRQRVVSGIEEAFRQARIRFGMRIVHYSIQGNHLHLIVEAEDRESLAKGMQGLAIRIARRLNALSGRHGGVFVDRYHSHALRSRREVANAVKYVLGNYRHHTREHLPARWDDPFSSVQFLRRQPGEDAPVVRPRTWLLRVGWVVT